MTDQLAGLLESTLSATLQIALQEVIALRWRRWDSKTLLKLLWNVLIQSACPWWQSWGKRLDMQCPGHKTESSCPWASKLNNKESRVTVVYSCSDLLSQIKRLAFLAQGGKGGTGHIFVGETHHRPLAPPSAVSALRLDMQCQSHKTESSCPWASKLNNVSLLGEIRAYQIRSNEIDKHAPGFGN